MKEPIAALLHQRVWNGNGIVINKKLVVINLFLVVISIAFFVPVHLLLNGLQTVVQQLLNIKSIVLIWIAVNVVVSLIAIKVHSKISKIKNTSEPVQQVEEDGTEPKNGDAGYLCMKVSGSKNIIWLNGHLFDISKNDIQRLVMDSADISLSSLCN